MQHAVNWAGLPQELVQGVCAQADEPTRCQGAWWLQRGQQSALEAAGCTPASPALSPVARRGGSGRSKAGGSVAWPRSQACRCLQLDLLPSCVKPCHAAAPACRLNLLHACKPWRAAMLAAPHLIPTAVLRLPSPQEPFADVLRSSDMAEMRWADMLKGERAVEAAATLHPLTYRVCVEGSEGTEQVQGGLGGGGAVAGMLATANLAGTCCSM